MDDEQIEYVCRPAGDIAAVGERRQLASVSLEPLRPFPIIVGIGDIALAEDEVLRASPPGEKSSPWGTYKIASATCLQPSTILVTDANELIRETWATPKGLRRIAEFSSIERERFPELMAGAPFHAAALSEVAELSGEYVLASSAPQGYFHWLVEYVPNTALLRGRKAKLLVPVMEHRWQKEALAHAGMSAEDVIEMHRHTHVSGDLTFADRIVPFECNMAPTIVPFFREMGSKSKRSAGRKVFISRAAAGRRNLTNEAAVLQKLEPLGFERIEAEALSFADQVALFASADIVVGPHGAGLTNIVFCAPGSIVVELNYDTFRWTFPRVTSYAGLSDMFDLKYGLVLGKAVSSPWRSYKRTKPDRRDRISDFEVSPEAVVRMLDALQSG